MKIDFQHSKIFTIFLSIFYILGLCAVFYNLKIILAILVFLILVFLIFCSDLGYKKVLVLYILFFIGIIRANCANNFDNFINEVNSKNSTITARIVSSKNVNIAANKVKFYVKTTEIDVYNKKFIDTNCKVLVSLDIDNNTKNILIGDTIQLSGYMKTPNNSTNPYQFDYKNYLLNNDTRFILYADNKSYKKIKEAHFSKDPEELWYFILKKFELTRNKILIAHGKNIKSPRLEILGGIVFGNETINPDEQVKESFRSSGLLHLLAASGLNVALIFGIWWWIANLLKFPYQLLIISGMVFVVFYTFMTGFPPSILRASLMLLFVLFGKLIDRTANSIGLIFFVALLILLVNPKMLFDIGFQLSFVVTLGLIICCSVIVSKFDDADKKFIEKYKNLSRFQKYFLFLFSPKSIAGIITIPLVAQIWVIPLQTHYFNNIAPWSIFANIAVVSFIGLLSFVGFLSSIIALIPVLNEPIVYLFDLIANPLTYIVIKISMIFSKLKYSLISTPGMSWGQMFIYWSGVIIFIFNLKNNFKNKKANIVFLLIVLVFLLSFVKLDNFRSNLEINMFDCGNGDCFLIKTPKNKYFLIDTGKYVYKGYSSGITIVNKYLKNERIKAIEAVIITHFDSDHSGGCIDILKNNKTNKVYIQKVDENSNLTNNIIDYLIKNKINYEIAKNNEQIYSEKDLKITLYKYDGDKNLQDNESGIVTLLTYKDKNILFMADCGVTGYENIQKYLPQNKINILKVGHHGAKNAINEKMLEKLTPDIALISAGNDRFDHPNIETTELLNKNNIKIVSTKQYGFVRAVIDKNAKNIELYHFDKKSKKIEPLVFDENFLIPFHETEFMKKLGR